MNSHQSERRENGSVEIDTYLKTIVSYDWYRPQWKTTVLIKYCSRCYPLTNKMSIYALSLSETSGCRTVNVVFRINT